MLIAEILEDYPQLCEQSIFATLAFSVNFEQEI
jgi:uncharacterized protein (DUF433 family)